MCLLPVLRVFAKVHSPTINPRTAVVRSSAVDGRHWLIAGLALLDCANGYITATSGGSTCTVCSADQVPQDGKCGFLEPISEYLDCPSTSDAGTFDRVIINRANNVANIYCVSSPNDDSKSLLSFTSRFFREPAAVSPVPYVCSCPFHQ